MKRICRKCGEEKEIRSFTKNNGCVHGREGTCKRCTKKQKNIYYKKNREKILKRDFERRNNPESRAASCKRSKEYRLKNPPTEKQLKAKKLYLIKNKKRISKQRKEYREKNGDFLREKQREKYKNNPDKYKESSNKYRQDPKNKEKIFLARKKDKKRSVAFLRDDYVRDFIRATLYIKTEDIASEMIELKRMQLKFHREIKKGKEQLNEIYQNV